MRKYIIAGNWKMNGSKASVQKLLENIKVGSLKIKDNVSWVVFPPYPFLEQTANLLKNTNIKWGAQNLSDKDSGAHTGEVSASMLKEFGCHYVLVGHSERRTLYGENNEMVAAKFVAASNANLIPILCIGETLEERKTGYTQKIIKQQLDAILNLENGVKRLANAVIAYEPVWAIGTGVTATPEQAEEVHRDIRAQIAMRDPNIAQKLQILYGGSVKPDNAKSLFAMPDIDGGLIGGASLKAEDFLKIGELCNS